MPWEICFGGATNGIRQEHYISVNSKSVVSYGQYSQCQIKNHHCFLLAYKEERYFYMLDAKDNISCSGSETYSFMNETGGCVLQN